MSALPPAYRIRSFINITRASVYPGCDREQINRLFDRLGPTPRLSLVFSSYGLRTYEDDLRRTIKSLTPEALEKLFDDAGALEMSKLSHKICLISRDTPEDVAGLPIVKPITLHVRSKLICQTPNSISIRTNLLLPEICKDVGFWGIYWHSL